MLRFEAEPTHRPSAEPSPAYGNDVFRAVQRASAFDMARRNGLTPEVAAEIERLSPIAGPGRFVLIGNPCGCDFCTHFGDGSQWTAERVEDFAARARDRIMAGVDMPGRIVDDVRPDQRGP